jgi:hypothetical protein
VCWLFKCKNRVSIGKSDRWFVLLDGKAVAMIDNPVYFDMFWFSWQIHEIFEKSIPPDLWECAADARRLFQHVDTGEIDPMAIPSLTQPPPETGKVVIRGPLHGRGPQDLGRKSLIGSLFQRAFTWRR